MKTQISSLRSGTKNQILNPEVDYTQLPKATSHVGHAGTNAEESMRIFSLVKQENPEALKFSFQGLDFEAKANWSTSGKSVDYRATLPTELFEDLTGVKVGLGKTASISIQGASAIILDNGKNYQCQVCPSLITILD